MTILICSQCNDDVDVEARSVVLPFVCKWCEEGFHEGDEQPESEGFTEPENDQFDLDTELIEDLQNRLTEANKNGELKDARIRVLEGSRQNLAANTIQYVKLLNELIALYEKYDIPTNINAIDFAIESRDKMISAFREWEFNVRNRTLWERLWS